METVTQKITATQARARIRSYLIKKYHVDARDRNEIAVWGHDKARELNWYYDGPSRAGGQVCWEGGPYEWAYNLTDDFANGKLELPGWWLECATSFIVTLYPKDW
jgi:hypothetical protein